MKHDNGMVLLALVVLRVSFCCCNCYMCLGWLERGKNERKEGDDVMVRTACELSVLVFVGSTFLFVSILFLSTLFSFSHTQHQ